MPTVWIEIVRRLVRLLDGLPYQQCAASATAGQSLPQPPFGGQRKKWRRYTVKKPELPDAEVKHLPSTALLEQDATQPPKGMDEEMRPGYQPQEQRHQRRLLTQEEREVFDDMTELFLHQRKCVSVDVAYSLLRAESRAYIRSLREL